MCVWVGRAIDEVVAGFERCERLVGKSNINGTRVWRGSACVEVMDLAKVIDLAVEGKGRRVPKSHVIS